MAYDKEELEKQAIEAIKEHTLFFITDILAFLPCKRATFYNLGLDKLDSIKAELNKNKIKVKSSMRNKWYKSDNATLQVALMKLICDEEERKKLSQTYNKIDADIKESITPEDPKTLTTLLKIAQAVAQNDTANNSTPAKEEKTS